MRNSWTAAKVGLLVLIAVGASYGVYRLVDEQAGGSGDGYQVHAIFNDASGLVKKSRVVIAGIQVGYIDDIRLQGEHARVDIHIDSNVELFRDAMVAKRSVSILGESVLAISPGTRSQPRIHGGAEIAIQPETPGTDAILANVARISESVLAVTRQIERTFGTDEAGQQMRVALSSLSQALESINRTIAENEHVIAAALRNVESITETAAPRLASILENIDVVTQNVRNVLAQNENGINQGVGGFSETMGNVQRSSAQLEAVLADLRQVIDRTTRGEDTIGRLTNDEALIDEVQGVAEGVGDIVGGIARLQTIIGLRTEYNFLANTFKSYVQLRLQPREDRYYYLELINDPRGLTSYEETEITESPPPVGTPEVRQVRTVRTRDAFRFSLGFAKRVGFATFRFGIMESTGGIGIDLHFLNDNIEITNDVFAIGEQAYPRMRTRLAVEIVTRLWILGGIDDYFNSSRDFFLGAALRFNDEDLKSILPFAGGLAGGG
ncbi:MAG: MCE family protein [Sandaracinaceae bacterium]|nr:MCE family protein [Sandaracinaceae bacterium]